MYMTDQPSRFSRYGAKIRKSRKCPVTASLIRSLNSSSVWSSNLPFCHQQKMYSSSLLWEQTSWTYSIWVLTQLSCSYEAIHICRWLYRKSYDIQPRSFLARFPLNDFGILLVVPSMEMSWKMFCFKLKGIGKAIVSPSVHQNEKYSN